MRTILKTTLAYALAAMLTGCGKPAPTIKRLPEDATILAYGNSLTFGTGSDREHSYPAVLSRITGYRVINAGVPGELSSDGLKRLGPILRKHGPDLVVLCHGGNDMLRGGGEQELTRNLSGMIRTIKESGADVILVGVPRPGLRLKTPELYDRVAREHSVPSDTTTLPKILSSRSLKSDRAHPNDQGYRKLAEAIASLIKTSETR